MFDQPHELFEFLGISLMLGLLVGLQREHADSPIAGLRTFPLITVLGTLAAILDKYTQSGGVILAAGFVAVAAIVVIANLHQLRAEQPDPGTTTQAALLLMFALGAYIYLGNNLIVAVAVGAGVAVLLQFKPELHGLVAKLGDVDVRAIMQFVLITCIVLPVLPDKTYGPLNVLNPHETWRMVVLMVGISLGGYLIYKFFGRNAGIILGGILGGAISSTATTLSYARRTKSNAEAAQLAAIVIMIASTVVYLRVLLEIGVIAPTYLWQLAPPILVMMLASAVTASVVWYSSKAEADEMPLQSNPTQLRSAIIFAVLYAGVLFMLAAAKTELAEEYIGDFGIYAIAAVSGMTDMDAITLSTARLVQDGPDNAGMSTTVGWQLIIVASMANLVFKALIAATVGHRRLLRPIILLFSVPFATGGILLAVSFWHS